MNLFKAICKSTTCRYAFFGIAFGFLFPIVAIAFDVVLNRGIEFNLRNIILTHRENPIHYIIDTAPLFLGIAFGIAGHYLEKARLLNQSLKLQAETMENANNRLTKALEDIQKAQDLLVKTEKLASLGQLTAGIVHEIKNPLNFITNFSESGIDLLDELLNSHSEAERKDIIDALKENFKKINLHGKKANNTVQSMMMFARTGKMIKKISDVNQVCTDAAEVAYHGMSSSIIGFKCNFQKNLDLSIPKINIIYEDVSRVILNLLTNSFYSVHQRRLKEDENYNPKVSLATGLIPDSSYPGQSNIFITITDNGVGIPENAKEKIFSAFYTSKPAGEGTGLGLNISQDIISLHGGIISFVSEENSSTEFRIQLPLDHVEEVQKINFSSSLRE
jgi:signal transduction histidine kinase